MKYIHTLYCTVLYCTVLYCAALVSNSPPDTAEQRYRKCGTIVLNYYYLCNCGMYSASRAAVTPGPAKWFDVKALCGTDLKSDSAVIYSIYAVR
jgi:hypothetical protein